MKANYFQQLIALFKRLLIVLFLFSISRLFFYILNRNYFIGNQLDELIRVFLWGIRFDISSIIIYNFPIIVLMLIPLNFALKSKFQKTVLIIFWILNSLLLFTNYIDSGYFAFTSKRTSFDFFKYAFVGDDTIAMIPKMILDFWYVPFVWIITTIIGYIFLKKTIVTPKAFLKSNYLVSASLFVLALGFLFVLARGLKYKPIRMISAGEHVSSQNIPLLLSTPFTLMHTYGSKSLVLKSYMAESAASTIFDPVKNYQISAGHRPNVVIIVLEGISNQYIGFLSGKRGYTPFLDSLAHSSLVFINAFANGRRSIEAIPFIFAGLPGLQENPFISSEFSGNRITSLPHLLHEKSYYSAFFHGGKNGTMSFDAFASIAGFDNYFGLNEYDAKHNKVENWGIDDYEFLKFAGQKMERFKRPFLAGIFTLTSHHPFIVPEPYTHKFPIGPHPMFSTVAYTDFSLRAFFKQIEKNEWFKNTIFVITADHTGPYTEGVYATRTGMYRIPIIIFDPSGYIKPGISHKIAQQADILETIVSIIGVSHPFVSFGNSLLADSAKGFSTNYANGIYQLIQNHYSLSFDGNESISLFDWKVDSMETNNIVNDSLKVVYTMELKLKSLIQQYNNRMVKNKMSFESY